MQGSQEDQPNGWRDIFLLKMKIYQSIATAIGFLTAWNRQPALASSQLLSASPQIMYDLPIVCSYK